MHVNCCRCYYYYYFLFAPGSAYLNQTGEFDRLNDPNFSPFSLLPCLPRYPSDLGFTHIIALIRGACVHPCVHVGEWSNGVPDQCPEVQRLHSLLLAFWLLRAQEEYAPTSLLVQELNTEGPFRLVTETHQAESKPLSLSCKLWGAQMDVCCWCMLLTDVCYWNFVITYCAKKKKNILLIQRVY